MVSLIKQPRRRPRICGAMAMMPVDLIAIMFASIQDSSDPTNVRPLLRCHLAQHPAGHHHDLVWELDDPSEGEVWAQWADGHRPDAFRIVPDCNAMSGPTPRDEACTLYVGHPGCHTWQYSDPEAIQQGGDPRCACPCHRPDGEGAR
ncbi:hypothetical protein ABZX40_22990 [Streptomyces sp. NPDC004610]|uniref:hypothetical protein n=1 Tax=unclassified Streptomyces TaxID=2593676 RepID=UPI0033ACD704